EYMSFKQDEDGRRVFISVDSRAIHQNPLYNAFKAKTFTNWDMVLHFHLLDILKVSDGLVINEIMDELIDRLLTLETADLPDESTVRKKLKEYQTLGLIVKKRRGRQTLYLLSEDHLDLTSWNQALAFFSEEAPLGVIGSFIQDQQERPFHQFRFKHHYILDAIDSENLYDILQAINRKRLLDLKIRKQQVRVLPLKVYIGTQTGRQYLLAWMPSAKRFSFYRIDLIDKIKTGEVTDYPEDLAVCLEDFRSHVWGVSTSNATDLVHLEMTVRIDAHESFVIDRLKREKRCGSVRQLDETHWLFSADVYDAIEMIPWLRTFIGRITHLSCTDQEVTKRFFTDLQALSEIYGGEADAVS
ncbi:MAG: WYL domain-containing protein, partial [bacterium]